jgi:transposase
MDHVAIDLGGRESQICVRRPDGTVVEERRVRTGALPTYLQGRAVSRVIVETCSEAFWVADAAQAAGHEVRVVPATLAPTLGIGARRLKTDRRDAQVLSEVSCRIDLPSVHIPRPDARAAKTLCGMRDGLVRSRTLLINTVRGWVRTQGRRLGTGGVLSFGPRVRTAFGAALPGYVDRQLQAIEHLHAGVGPVTAVRFLAAIDDRTRFTGAHAVEAYVGLVPGQDSSGPRTRYLGITKAGSPALRWCLVQAAHCAKRTLKPGPLRDWVDAVAHRRGRQVAVVALARKLTGILFALWRDATVYDPLRTNQRPATA